MTGQGSASVADTLRRVRGLTSSVSGVAADSAALSVHSALGLDIAAAVSAFASVVASPVVVHYRIGVPFIGVTVETSRTTGTTVAVSETVGVTVATSTLIGKTS